MQVNLKVIGGKNDGRLIRISVPEFVIGRGEQAHLRPSSELISRMHCSLKINDGQVTVEDMGSRNGTYVNEEKIEGVYTAKVGDVLRVGRLQFEVLIDHVEAGIKRPKINDVVEAASRTATKKSEWTEDSINDWLTESAEESDKGLYETRQFALDETKYRLETSKAEDHTAESRTADDRHADDRHADDRHVDESTGVAEASDDSVADDSDDTERGAESNSGVFGFKRKKKQPMKLPQRPKADSVNTKDAAGEVLRKFFNQR